MPLAPTDCGPVEAGVAPASQATDNRLRVAFRPKFLAALTSNHEALAEAYLKKGDKARAAESSAKAGLHPRAAKLFAETGNTRRAVQTTLLGVLGRVPDGDSDATPRQAGSSPAPRTPRTDLPASGAAPPTSGPHEIPHRREGGVDLGG